MKIFETSKILYFVKIGIIYFYKVSFEKKVKFQI